MDQYLLFYPGPVNVSRRVILASNQITTHTEKDFLIVLNEIEELFFDIFDIPESYTILLLPGSGTLAIEAVLTSLPFNGDKLLIINDGVYGEHITNIAKFHQLPSIEVTTTGEVPVNTNTVEEILTNDSSIRYLAFVHHETSTGLLNYIEDLCNIAKRYNKFTIIDAISSLGGEAFNFKEWSPHTVITSSYACLQGIPGINIIIIKEELIPLILKGKPHSFYLNLANYYIQKTNNKIPFTLPVQVIFGLREALLELYEEGVARRVERYSYFKEAIKKELLNLNYELLLPYNVPESSSVLSVKLPSGYNFEDLYSYLSTHGIIVAPGLGKFKEIFFRISTMGWIQEVDVKRLIKLLTKFKRTSP